ncbi:Probable peptide/nitrate transporter At3g43790 [Linum perenne]
MNEENFLPQSFYNFSSLFQQIKDFHIAEREEDIGFYAGFVGSSFMIGRALTSFFWGRLADRYGRKPVILIGTFSVVIFNALFGLSSSFWMAISMRFLLGCFNSLLGTIRAYASEVCREEHRSLALSIPNTPCRFPYFLPCLLISIYSLGVFIACWWLPETLHMHGREASAEESSVKGRVEEMPQKQNLLKNWPLMSTIIVYCVFSLQEIAYSEIFSLWAVSDKKYGGLSFSSQAVGEVLAISGLGLLLFQLLLYPPIERVIGPLVVTRLSAVSLVTGLFILQNNAVPQSQRAAANGISLTAMSVFKSFGPAGGGALFSLAQKRQVASFLPGDQMVFFVLNLIQLIGLILTFKPFLALPT